MARGEPVIEWTGERYVPEADDITVHYEHLHRYRMAADVVAGRRVIDLACGEGYGSALMAEAAAFVLGVDNAAAVIAHAAAKYRRPNLAFAAGSITALPLASGARFDVAVCFEALEHVQEQALLLAEAKRVLSPAGVLLISTPDVAQYHDDNPFHVRELTREGFEALLRAQFRHVRLFGQLVAPVSQIFPLDAPTGPARTYAIGRRGEGFAFAPEAYPAARYLIAAAYDEGPPPEDAQVRPERVRPSLAPAALSGSFLVDVSSALLQDQGARMDRTRAYVLELERQVADKNRHIAEVAVYVRSLESRLGKKQ